MRVIPIADIASQEFSVLLGGQNCTINIYQKSTGLFLDLAVGGAPIVSCVLCRDRVKLVRAEYRGFIGNLVFVDQEGSSDPAFGALGSRYVLLYLEASDL